MDRALERFGARAAELLGVSAGPVRLFEGPPSAWKLSLEAGEARIWLRDQESADGALFQHAAYALSYEQCTTPGWATALERTTPSKRDALADALTTLRRETRLAPPAPEPLDAHSIDAFGDEASLIRPLLDSYRDHYGRGLELVRWPSGPPSILFPDVVQEQSVFATVSVPFAEDVRMRAYLRDLGYGLLGRKMRLVPTPAAFRARRAAVGLGASGFAARLIRARIPVLRTRPWLVGLAEGTFTVNLRSARLNRWTRLTREIGRRLHPELAAMWHTHFHALGHDMGLHVFALHRIPESGMADLKARARRAAQGRRRNALSTAAFFEGELTRRCVDIWDKLAHPAEFAARFAAEAAGDDR